MNQLFQLFFSPYGLSLAAVILAGLTGWGILWHRRSLSPVLFGLACLLSLVLGLLGSRCFSLLVRGILFSSRTGSFFSAFPYEYAFCGTLLGILAALTLTALAGKLSFGTLADTAAIPLLITAAAARLCEALSDFGWGSVVAVSWAQHYPFSLMDNLWGEWHLAVFNLEALLALAALFPVLRTRTNRPGARFALALTWWSMGQIFCETLRTECLRWGFIPVQQVTCALLALAAGLWGLIACRNGRKPGFRWEFPVYAAGVALVAGCEWALDKWVLPAWIDYTVMAAALLVMGHAITRLIIEKQKTS